MRNKSLLKKMFAVAIISSLLMLELSGCSSFPEPNAVEGSPASETSVKAADEKTVIREKMMNAHRHYHTLKGKLSYRYDKISSSIEFQFRQGDKPAAYLLRKDQKINTSDYSVYNGKYLLTTWDSLRDPSVRFPDYSSEKDEIQKSAVPFTVRGMPHPHRLAETLLASSDWTIEGKESFLGRSTVIIMAGPNPHAGFPVEKTKLWIDEETGLLLRNDYFHDNGKQLTVVEMLELEVNEPLEEDRLTIPSEYIAQFELTPEQLENEIHQVESALRDFYDQRRKQDFSDLVEDFSIISISRRESARHVCKGQGTAGGRKLEGEFEICPQEEWDLERRVGSNDIIDKDSLR